MTTATVSGPHPGLVRWLRNHGVDHEFREHREAFTALRTARADGVDARTFAKVVGVAADDGRRALLLLDAPDHLDVAKARVVLGAKDVRLLDERKLALLAPDCEPGAIPAVGGLFGLLMYADHAIAADPEISFDAGTHRSSVRVDRRAWERATGVIYADLAVDEPRATGRSDT
jgi:Ala-tRNA(Pro) deacylase